MNIVIYAGTFNPIHTGHLIMAEYVRTELNADKVIFIPSFNPPHRDKNIESPFHRLNLVKLAIKNNPYFEVSDIEFNDNEKSYTYNTILKLKNIFPNTKEKFKFIIGTDAFNLIQTWYKSEELKNLLDFIVIERPDEEGNVEKVKVENYHYTLIKAPAIEISSSMIRKRINNKKSIKYLVSEVVEDYILQNSLYL
ncbi:MAG: nicotinate (nicotinamide) nucleotide adenylyltransferase [bacterium]